MIEEDIPKIDQIGKLSEKEKKENEAQCLKLFISISEDVALHDTLTPNYEEDAKEAVETAKGLVGEENIHYKMIFSMYKVIKLMIAFREVNIYLRGDNDALSLEKVFNIINVALSFKIKHIDTFSLPFEDIIVKKAREKYRLLMIEMEKLNN